jgi:undecaprenyl-diphosphatase
MQDIIQLDYYLFYIIHIKGNNSFLDFLLPLLRNAWFWTPFYAFLLVFFIVNFKKKSIHYILSFLLCFALSDSISSKVIKPIVKRDRPCQNQQLKPIIRPIVSCGSGKSFPSSHATNHFSMAVILVLILKKQWRNYRFILLLWAFSIAYAQVYVGVHFVVDVLVGAILGSLIAFIVYYLYKNIYPKAYV